MPRDSLVALAVPLIIVVLVAFISIWMSRREAFAAPPMRPCAVYYTKNTDICDQFSELYEKTPNWRAWRISEIQKKGASTTDAEKREQEALVAIQAEKPAAPKYCKLDFPGFTEIAANPRKIVPEADVRGPPEHWAFCFKANPDRAAAEQNAREFGDRGAVVINDDTTTSFSDTNTYNRIQFRDLTFDSVRHSKCIGATEGGLSPGFPVLLGIEVDPFTMKASGKMIGVQRDASGRLVPYANPLELFARLFRLYGENYQYVMRPYRSQIVVYKISKNVCGQDVVYNTIPLALDLAQAGLGAEAVVSGLPYATPNRKTMLANAAEIQERINSIAATVKDLEAKYVALTATTTTGGLNRSVYFINSPDHWPQTTAQMDTLFANRVRLVKQGVDTIVHFRSDTRVPGVREGYAIEWRGMLRAPASGNYWFNINSDDAADAYVNGKLVTTYYGGHWFNKQGVTLTSVYLNAGEFYPIHIRMMEWWGDDGMELSVRSDAPGVGNDWKFIPKEWLYYISDPNLNTYTAQMDMARQEIKQLEERKRGYDHWMAQVQGNQGAVLRKYADAMRDRDVSAIFQRTHLSDDQIIYLDVGAYLGDAAMPNEDRQILVNSPIELNVPRTVAPPQVPFHQTPTYTIAMWIKVDRGATWWRNIVFFGAQDDWTDWDQRKNNNPLIDRTPGLWVYPDNTMRLHYRHRARTTPNGFNDGIDVTDPAKLPSFGQWFHYATVIRENTAKTYINGKLVESRTLTANFEWNDIRKKTFRVGMENWGNMAGIHIQRLHWYNRVLSDDEITTLSQEK